MFKNKDKESKIDETWLIPYAYLLTLLLALFIILFAASSVDIKKFEQLSSSLNTAFHSGAGIMDYPSPIDAIERSAIPPGDRSEENKAGEDLKLTIEQELEKLSDLQEKINQYIAEKNLSNSLQ